MAVSYADWFAQYANTLGLPSATIQQLQSNVTDPGQEYALMQLLGEGAGGMNAIGTQANSARERLANNVRTNAYDAGLSDYSTVSTDKTVAGQRNLNEADRVTYKVVMGPDGRAYRQAFLNNAAAVGRRSWGGSDDRSTQWTSKQALNANRAKLQDNLTTSQNDTITQQGIDEGAKRREFETGIIDYGKWKIDNMPQSPAGQPAAAAPGAAPAPDAAPPAAAASRPFVWEGQHDPRKHAKATATLNKTYGAGMWTVKRRGPNAKSKFVVVLR